MKAVLISIQPKWCELIASGKKTIEVRKTRPKIEMPFKCYIYETMAQFIKFVKGARTSYGYGRGQVIGEFVCDFLDEFAGGIGIGFKRFHSFAETCLTVKEMQEYLKGKNGYGWHISELKIYDKPKALGEFRKAGFMTEEEWLYALYPNTHCHYQAWAKRFELTRPPQSWCFVEEMSE